LLIYIDTASSS